jgi:DNA polymerase III subunit gamma/tau
VWDTKYRPLRFSDVLGQQGTVQVLKSRLRNGSALDTSYIFCGGPGQGKTTLARILARAILCQRLDKNDPEPCNECENCKGVLDETLGAFVELDAASRGTIEHVRKIVDDLPFAVFGATKRVYVIDECHRMSKDAQDVLLKPLEEKKLVGMFCTTEPEKVRGAIRSRCEEYAIRKVTREDILARMKTILTAEGVEHEDEAVLIVIDFSGGHVRDVINRLEMVSQMGPVTVESVRSHLNLSVISTYYEILLRIPHDTKGALAFIDQACERVTPEEVAAGLAEAAMTSFRMASGMTADFTFADKDLGKKAHELYGLRLVKIADYFLRSRYITQVGLVCDVISLAQDLRAGAAPTSNTQQRPTIQPLIQPTVVETPALVAVASPSSPVEAAVVPVETVVPPVAPPPPVPAPPPPVAPPPVPAPPPLKFVPSPKASGPDVRPDGIGPLGQDPCALSEFDHVVIQSGKPKNAHEKMPLVFDDSRSRDGRELLSPSVWRRQFETLWLSRGSGPSGDI